MRARKWTTWLLGRPLRTDEQETQGVTVLTGLPFLGLDALASAAYGPEAALTTLMPLGARGVPWIVPLLLIVIVVLVAVSLSYRQTIAAYPEAGGSYAVTRQNLGQRAGVVAGAALFLDYVLNVAVGISAGVGALVSAVPSLLPHTLPLTLLVLAVLTLAHLRGPRSSGIAFLAPTSLFVVGLLAVIAFGVARGIAGHTPPWPGAAARGAGVGSWLLIRAFASGCAALTGIEAVADAVPVFREPRVARARRTLACITVLLGVLLVGIAVSCVFLGVAATPAGHAGYESVLSRLTAAVFGRGLIYHVIIGAIVAVVCVSASTSFADFPRLCRLLAIDGFLPSHFAHQGPRLVYSSGIGLLAVLAGALLVIFGGVTDRLIPLFAIGAFASFTMSQISMARHWARGGARRRVGPLIVNALGATATAATLVILIASKFQEGAWVSLLLLAALLASFWRMRARARDVAAKSALDEPVVDGVRHLEQPFVLVPLKRLDEIARKALRFALTIGAEIQAVQVLATKDIDADLSPRWSSLVEEPCRRAGLPVPRLVVFHSSFRQIVDPLLEHVRRVAALHPEQDIVVVIPELVRRHWYHLLFRSHTTTLLKARLLMSAGPRVVIANAPWYLGEETTAAQGSSPRPDVGSPPDETRLQR